MNNNFEQEMTTKLSVFMCVLFTVLISVCALFMQGCSDDSSSGGSSEPTAQTETKPEIKQASQPQGVESKKEEPFFTSFNVATTSELPECSQDIQGALAYVKSSNSFVACVSSGWEAIDLRGPKGDKGDKGDQGDQGLQGIAGVDGQDGADGNDGQDANVRELGDTWVDPDSGTTWWIANAGQTYADALATCVADGYALPSAAFPYKLNYFFIGYFATLSNSAAYWTNVVSVSGHNTRTISTNGATVVDTADTATRFTFCVK